MSNQWNDQSILSETFFTTITNIHDFESLSIDRFREMCAMSSNTKLMQKV